METYVVVAIALLSAFPHTALGMDPETFTFASVGKAPDLTRTVVLDRTQATPPSDAALVDEDAVIEIIQNAATKQAEAQLRLYTTKMASLKQELDTANQHKADKDKSFLALLAGHSVTVKKFEDAHKRAQTEMLAKHTSESDAQKEAIRLVDERIHELSGTLAQVSAKYDTIKRLVATQVEGFTIVENRDAAGDDEKKKMVAAGPAGKPTSNGQETVGIRGNPHDGDGLGNVPSEIRDLAAGALALGSAAVKFFWD